MGIDQAGDDKLVHGIDDGGLAPVSFGRGGDFCPDLGNLPVLDQDVFPFWGGNPGRLIKDPAIFYQRIQSIDLYVNYSNTLF